MKLPIPTDITKDMAEFKEEISAIRVAVERLVEIEEAKR